jgi:hypothetical protein
MKVLDVTLMIAIIGLFFCFGGLVGDWAVKQRIEKAANNSIENMENLKRDCEKSLPGDKVCVMVFDYVSAENDYEH